LRRFFSFVSDAGGGEAADTPLPTVDSSVAVGAAGAVGVG
jgi:hypothetical protein